MRARPPRDQVRFTSKWCRRPPLPALLLTVLGGLFLAKVALAGHLDVARWTDRPGVKLVVVEFYATWCKPCMEAVPRWRELHERYRREGLRFVVVSTRDGAAGCANPGWSPDQVICDEDGSLAERFGATRLPAAFLWSWRGELLASAADVDEVEARIESWMAAAPRVNVQAVEAPSAAGIDGDGLRDAVRAELRRSDKLLVVASDEERAQLRDLVRASMGPFMEAKGACEVGQELSANSLLRAGISLGGRSRLHLQLFSAEKGCLVAAGSAPWYADKPYTSVAEAVAVLVGGLKLPALQRPQPAVFPPHREAPPEVHAALPPTEPEGSFPRGRLAAETGPSERSLDDVRTRSDRLHRELDGDELDAVPPPEASLEPPRVERAAPARGELSIVASQGVDPIEAEVYVDGIPVGRTPIDVTLAAGSSEVEVRSPDGLVRTGRVEIHAGARSRFAADFEALAVPGVEARVPPKPASRGTGAIVTGGVLIGAGAISAIAGGSIAAGDNSLSDDFTGAALILTGGVVGTAGLIVLTVGGILKATSGSRRRAWEAKYEDQSHVSWDLVPTLTPDGQPGLGLSGRF